MRFFMGGNAYSSNLVPTLCSMVVMGGQEVIFLSSLVQVSTA